MSIKNKKDECQRLYLDLIINNTDYHKTPRFLHSRFGKH
jgi:hypothetical protein